MPARKSAIILSICALALALLFQVSSVKAQTCPVPPTCACGTATCDPDGNCTCPQAPTCGCGEASCNLGQWTCETEPSCADCYAPSCDNNAWSCDYDVYSCGGGGGTEPLPCNSCDPECEAYSSYDESISLCLLV